MPIRIMRAGGRSARLCCARAKRRPLLVFLLLAGPGIMAMLGENDGPSMLSYATAGATFGIGFFIPFVMLTFAMSFVVQELTARLSIATGRGHARLILERFGPGWGRFAIFDLVAGNVLTLVTEFVAICAGARFFGVPAPAAAGLALAIAITAFTVGRYRTWAKPGSTPRSERPSRPSSRSVRSLPRHLFSRMA